MWLKSEIYRYWPGVVWLLGVCWYNVHACIYSNFAVVSRLGFVGYRKGMFFMAKVTGSVFDGGFFDG